MCFELLSSFSSEKESKNVIIGGENVFLILVLYKTIQSNVDEIFNSLGTESSEGKEGTSPKETAWKPSIVLKNAGFYQAFNIGRLFL